MEFFGKVQIQGVVSVQILYIKCNDFVFYYYVGSSSVRRDQKSIAYTLSQSAKHEEAKLVSILC